MIINEDGEVNESDVSGIVAKLKNFLLENYEPVKDPKDADMHLTTLEILEQLQKFIPSNDYGLQDVVLWLDNGGFTFYDFGELRFEWMMKKK